MCAWNILFRTYYPQIAEFLTCSICINKMNLSQKSSESKKQCSSPNSVSQWNNTSNNFKEIQNNHIKNAKELVKDFESSSEEEDLNEEEILEKLYKNYTASSNKDQLLSKTVGFLENVLHSGAATCLICIGSVKRADAIWSCKHCYCIFHLTCIKRWANDSLAQIKTHSSNQQNNEGYYNNLGIYVPPKKPKTLKWYCPQCRQDYQPNERPTRYECFCGKEINPEQQPWQVPHSCGEVCKKNLQPECGHQCLLLCHPGPCPPCPQNVFVSCKCSKSTPKWVRCFQKTWTCEKLCSEMLQCGKHRCEKECHEKAKCPPCSRTSKQKCVCQNEEATRNCSELIWHCKKVCNKQYPCGIHYCKKICHSDQCGECPQGLPRSCPCGKTKKIGPCNETIDSCGDTCQKTLSCGKHNCTQRCHFGECSTCLVITTKKCRCGKYEKELPCWKIFSCETKCKQIRDCGKHACNKKCCDGQCPPCDKICAKTLSCKKHKCKSICHEGPCYPCNLASKIHCRCGSTTKTVPCGRERAARITCTEPCRIPSKCHHKTRHRCHKNECPPCNEKCGLINTTTGCLHKCEARCHAAVKVSKKLSTTVKTIWDSPNIEFKALPHPQCEIKVVVVCIGGHEKAEWPCWNSKPSSCQRPCNRSLKCGRHKCDLVCHDVKDVSNMEEQEGCGSCTEGCNITRPLGCTHLCQRPCHLPPCQPCNAILKLKCHCGLTQLLFRCAEYHSVDEDQNKIVEIQDIKRSCGGRCTKNFPCGHRCNMLCHSGLCANFDSCRKKVRIFCECKLLKIEVSCDKHRSGLISIPCDETCVQAHASFDLMKKHQYEKQKLLEEEKNRLELEQFEKRFGKRKPKDRKTTTEKVKAPINWKLISVYVGLGVAFAAAVCVALFDGFS